jgi:hypothetical protein
MRIRRFFGLVLMLLGISVAASTNYVVAWRDSVSMDAAPQSSKQTFNTAPLGFAQQVGRQHATTPTKLPVVVDGRTRPELIPDWLAYHQLITASAIPTSASPQQINLRDARLKSMGFSQQDRDAYIAALSNVREELDQVAADQEMWTVDTPTAIAMRKALRGRRDQILEDTRVRLQTSLTSDGTIRLNSFVQNQWKRGLVVYGSMPLRPTAR